MKSTSCIKKDVGYAVRTIKRKVTYPCSIKINNAVYSHEKLKNYLGDKLIIVYEKDHLRLYDERRKFICVAEKSLDLPKQERIKKTAKKVPDEIPYTMKIHESLERIREGKLSDMNLLELSIHALMPADVFRELKRRIELLKKLLETCQGMTSF